MELNQDYTSRFINKLNESYKIFFETPTLLDNKMNKDLVKSKDSNELIEKGIITKKIIEEDKKLLNDHLIEKINSIREEINLIPEGKKIKFKNFNKPLDSDQFTEVYKICQKILFNMGVFDIFQELLLKKYKIKSCFLQLNNKKISSYLYQSLNENNLPSNNIYEYMHIDSKIKPRLKVLLYLNHINENNGPFLYSLGSNHDQDYFEKLIRKSNDNLDPSQEEFKSLPLYFQKHTLFSFNQDQLLLNLEFLKKCLEKEFSVIGSDDLILFDPDGVHRGGIVKEGERILLQILFEEDKV